MNKRLSLVLALAALSGFSQNGIAAPSGVVHAAREVSTGDAHPAAVNHHGAPSVSEGHTHEVRPDVETVRTAKGSSGADASVIVGTANSTVDGNGYRKYHAEQKHGD